MFTRRHLGIALTLCLMAGCGGGGETTSPPLPAEGTLKWKDGSHVSQLEGASVEFEKDGAVAAKAELVADGTFSLKEALPAGKYRVRVVPIAGEDTMMHPKFLSFDKSGLTVDAGAAPQKFDLKIAKR